MLRFNDKSYTRNCGLPRILDSTVVVDCRQESQSAAIDLFYTRPCSMIPSTIGSHAMTALPHSITRSYTMMDGQTTPHLLTVELRKHAAILFCHPLLVHQQALIEISSQTLTLIRLSLFSLPPSVNHHMLSILVEPRTGGEMSGTFFVCRSSACACLRMSGHIIHGSPQ